METNYEKRKKTVMSFIKDPIYTPMREKEIGAILGVNKEEKKELRKILRELEEEGRVHKSKKGRFKKGKAQVLQGIYRANQKGFGFVVIEEEPGRDVFIGRDDGLNAMDGDEVEISIKKEEEGRAREGKIIRIITRASDKIVGLYSKNKGKQFGFVLPDNQKLDRDIYIPTGKDKGAVDGAKVVVKLSSFGDENKKPEGKIVEIIGHVNDPGVDILSIVRDYALPDTFKEKTLNQAERVSKPVSENDRKGREDFREKLCITIDGEDAKDLDDAITLEVKEGNYLLGVHIADVTNYVQENSALDKEALERGTSVYLADRVIPMLPHILSNGICSLNQGEDRLTLSCVMTIDSKGNVISHKICESVTRVTKRMSYTQVQALLAEEDEELKKEFAEIIPMLVAMEELSKRLREKRRERGAIDFDFPESKIILDKEGKPIDIKPYVRNAATNMIEDFMLLANETVAEEYFWQEIPFLYRTHETPEEEKIKSLATFIQNFGYTMRIGQNEIKPKDIQKLLGSIEGSEEESLISRLILRSMKQAGYTTENTGHFGLAAKYYTHFTSPIRRYPDLQIHRIIKETLRGKMNQERITHYESILSAVAKQASTMERRAEEAERETIKLKKAEYMKDRVGQEYEGIISSITKWGMYVELPNTIEGLIHVTNLTDDHYDYLEDRYEMVGAHTGKVYKLGEKVKVQVLGADTLLRTIDFKLAKSGDK